MPNSQNDYPETQNVITIELLHEGRINAAKWRCEAALVIDPDTLAISLQGPVSRFRPEMDKKKREKAIEDNIRAIQAQAADRLKEAGYDGTTVFNVLQLIRSKHEVRFREPKE